jgi:UDP-N-acetylglucosamine 2-epimerase (non-hydrolysing)/GDP/UDP-N,N'-diacetylbacillosamine 2-epimerase (hydrolysing)
MKLAKRKIIVTTGTRAEYGILRPILREIIKRKKLELILVVTGTHLSKKYGMTINEIKKDKFKIYETFKFLPNDDTRFSVAKALGEGVIQFAKIFKKVKPDINLILGDRDEMLASAIAAYHMNIPNAHIHGGDVSRNIDEYTRHAITKISNIHFPSTEKSKRRIVKMGENPKFVFLTGSPSIDELRSNKILNKKQFENKYGFQVTKNLIVLIQHPVTTQIANTKKHIQNTLKAIEYFGYTTIIIAPNSDAGSNTIFQNIRHFAKSHNFVKIFPSLPRSDYLYLIKNCGVLVGNSSSGLIEASYFGTPAVNIGIRQQGREKSKNVFDAKSESVISIKRAILRALKKNTKPSYLYGIGNASQKIVRRLEKIKLNYELIEKQLTY